MLSSFSLQRFFVRSVYVKNLSEVVDAIKSIQADDGTPFGLLDNLMAYPDAGVVARFTPSIEALRSLGKELLNRIFARGAALDLGTRELKRRIGRLKLPLSIGICEKIKDFIRQIIEFQSALTIYIRENEIVMDQEEGALNRLKYKIRTRSREEYPQTLYALDHLLEKLYTILYMSAARPNDYYYLYRSKRSSKPMRKSLPEFPVMV
jgi:hypothetical protein